MSCPVDQSRPNEGSRSQDDSLDDVPEAFWDQRPQEPVPIVFLDVDGVLHSMAHARDSSLQFTESCMQHLKNVLERSGARIVLSSTWRLTLGPARKLNEALRIRGILCPIGATPLLSGDPSYERMGRAAEILRWVSLNEDLIDNDQWVAIDDIPLDIHLLDEHAVVIDGSVGLTGELAEEVFQKLQGFNGSDINKVMQDFKSAGSGGY